jgi:hypothetical protein
LCDPAAARPLAELLGDPSEPVRRAAAAALGRLGVGGHDLLAYEASFAGDARVEFLGALAVTRLADAKPFFEKEIRRHPGGSPGRFACEVGLFLLGPAEGEPGEEGKRRRLVIEAALGRIEGANPTLALIALVLAGDPESEKIARAAIRARSSALRESVALALGAARPDWAGPLLREAAEDRDPRVALRARVGLTWLGLRGASEGR